MQTNTKTRIENARSHRIAAELAALMQEKIEQDAYLASLYAQYPADRSDPSGDAASEVIGRLFDSLDRPSPVASFPPQKFALRG